MPTDRIKAKDLTFDSSLPPFLQRLHAHSAGLGDQDRKSTSKLRRPRAKEDDEDNGPTVVDEKGDLIPEKDLDELRRGVKETTDPAHAQVSAESAQNRPVKRVEQKISDGTALKKRRLAKVVGSHQEGEQDEQKAGVNSNGQNGQPTEKRVATKSRPRAKKIKLAFQEDEDA